MSSTGVIRRLVKEHGYGFIASNSGKDIFFHYTQLQGVDFPSLKEGQSVSFKIGLGSKGLEAVDVKLASDSLGSLGSVQLGWPGHAKINSTTAYARTGRY